MDGGKYLANLGLSVPMIAWRANSRGRREIAVTATNVKNLGMHTNVRGPLVTYYTVL